MALKHTNTPFGPQIKGAGKVLTPKVTYTGDPVEAKKWRVYALKKAPDVLKAASHRDKIQYSPPPSFPQEGIEITYRKIYNQIFINIDAAEKGVAKKVAEEEEQLSLRFFVRVGEPGDLVYHANGSIITDNTKYYWIDFGAISGEDAINLYKTDGSVHTSEDGFLASLVELPSGADHTQVKAFNYSWTDPNDYRNVVTTRFVAGYHYLLEHREDNSRFYMAYDYLNAGEMVLLLDEATQLSQATCNDATLTNRFYANLDSGMLAWYRVLQEWPVDEFVRTEADGQISGYIGRLGYNSELARWGIYNDSFTYFQVAPLHVATATTHISNTPVKEETCLFVDIYELTPDSLKVNTTLDHRPLLYNALTGDIEYPDELYCWEHTEDGFTQRLAMIYEHDNGGSYSKATKTDTLQTITTGGSCGSHDGDESGCLEHIADFYNQYYQTWWTIDITASNVTDFTVYPYHGSYNFFTGDKSEDYFSRIYELAGNCTWFPISQTCGGSTSHPCEPYRNTYWVAYGEVTDRFYGRTYGNNIHFGDKNIDTWGFPTFNNRKLSCSNDVLIESHATCSPAGGASVNATNDWGTWISRLSGGTPNHCVDNTGSDVHTLMVSQWPGNDQVIDDSCGSPSPISSMSAVLIGGRYRWEADDKGSGTATTQLDSYKVSDELTYTESSIDSIRHLDDRSTEGTHGLCIVAKLDGKVTKATHGSDGITSVLRDKYSDLVTALEELGSFEEPTIFDIGLA